MSPLLNHASEMSASAIRVFGVLFPRIVGWLPILQTQTALVAQRSIAQAGVKETARCEHLLLLRRMLRPMLERGKSRHVGPILWMRRFRTIDDHLRVAGLRVSKRHLAARTANVLATRSRYGGGSLRVLSLEFQHASHKETLWAEARMVV